MPEAKEKVKSKLKIKLKSYDHKVVDESCKKIISLAERNDVNVIGPIPLPTEIHKYTVNRSTFVHKDSREQFEMRVHKRLIEILEPNQRFLASLGDLTLPSGVQIEVKTL